MRNLTLTFCLFLVSIQFVNAQSQSVVWRKCFGGAAKDVATDVLINNDGSLIVVGYSHSNNGSVTGHHGDASTSDGWITKLDQAGNLVWQKSLGGTANDFLNTVVTTGDGGYLCTGYTYSNDGDVTGNHGMADVWAVRLDGDGALIWSKCYGGSQIDTAVDAVRLYDGQFALIGSTNSTDGNVLSGPLNNTAYDAWVIKLSSADGNLMWERVINYRDSINDDRGVNIVESNNNTIIAYIAGAYPATFWSWDQWNTRIENTGVTYQLNESNGSVAFLSASGGGWQEQMAMCKSNSGCNFMFDNKYFTASPIQCYSYIRAILKQDFAGNLINKTVTSTSPCDDSHPGIPASIISNSHGLIISSNGKFVTAGQVELVSQFGPSSITSYVSNIGAVGLTDNNDKFLSIKEFAVGDEFIVVGYTNSGKLTSNETVLDFHGNLDFWVIKFQSLNRIQGDFYIDYNNNNIQDAGEPPFKRAVAKTIKQNSTATSWAYPFNGISESIVDLGTFKTTGTSFRPYYTIAADTTITTFTTYKNTVSINYPVHPVPGARDYAVFLSGLSPVRPGAVTSYSITCSNLGVDTLLNKKVMLTKDNHLHFASANPAPVSVVADTVTWVISQLLPDSSISIMLRLTADSIPQLNLGDTLHTTVYIDSTGDVIRLTI